MGHAEAAAAVERPVAEGEPRAFLELGEAALDRVGRLGPLGVALVRGDADVDAVVLEDVAIGIGLGVAEREAAGVHVGACECLVEPAGAGAEGFGGVEGGLGTDGPRIRLRGGEYVIVEAPVGPRQDQHAEPHTSRACDLAESKAEAGGATVGADQMVEAGEDQVESPVLKGGVEQARVGAGGEAVLRGSGQRGAHVGVELTRVAQQFGVGGGDDEACGGGAAGEDPHDGGDRVRAAGAHPHHIGDFVRQSVEEVVERFDAHGRVAWGPVAKVWGAARLEGGAQVERAESGEREFADGGRRVGLAGQPSIGAGHDVSVGGHGDVEDEDVGALDVGGRQRGTGVGRGVQGVAADCGDPHGVVNSSSLSGPTAHTA